MRTFIYLALFSLLVTLSVQHKSKNLTLKCFAGREFHEAIRAIKTLGVKNFIRNKLTLQGITKSLTVALQCVKYSITSKPSDSQSILAKIGMVNLVLSNCEKDVGAVFLLLDNVVQQIKAKQKNWPNIIIASVMDVLLAKQGVTDCVQAYEYIRSLFN